MDFLSNDYQMTSSFVCLHHILIETVKKSSLESQRGALFLHLQTVIPLDSTKFASCKRSDGLSHLMAGS